MRAGLNTALNFFFSGNLWEVMAEEKTAAQVAIYSGAEKMAELCLRAVSLMEASAEAACRAIAIEQLLKQEHTHPPPN